MFSDIKYGSVRVEYKNSNMYYIKAQSVLSNK